MFFDNKRSSESSSINADNILGFMKGLKGGSERGFGSMVTPDISQKKRTDVFRMTQKNSGRLSKTSGNGRLSIMQPEVVHIDLAFETLKEFDFVELIKAKFLNIDIDPFDLKLILETLTRDV